jgi:hypothetical protein
MRCFIIGNGKSLNLTNLDLIAGRPSIACNRIGLKYPETTWRPTIYVHPESFAPDMPFIREHVEMGIECWLAERYTFPPRGEFDLPDAPNIHWIKECHHWYENFDSKNDVPDEWHMPQLCSFGGSVNVAMQIAVLKGYDELVLLGCDLEYRDGKKQDHFHPDYKHGAEQPAFYAARNALYGHLQALNYIRRKKLNVKVYNATPGGMLELWERKDFQECL